MSNEWDREQLVKFEKEQLQQRQGETLTVLEALRRSRKTRGGVGAPLQVPAHLQPAAAIVVTDADLKPSKPITGE
jgi:hypothetical protein